MRDFINDWMGEIILLICVIAVCNTVTVCINMTQNHELSMAKQGYVEVQGVGTRQKFWQKEIK